MKSLIFTILLALVTVTCFSQILLTGKVVDSEKKATEKNGIPGANIVIKGTVIGTTTDSNGNFSLRLSKEQLAILDSSNLILSVNSVGLIPQEAKYDFKKGFEVITLMSDVQALSPEKENYAKSVIYFATDRNRTTSILPSQKFGPRRATNSAAPMTYGTCTISIPHDHRVGEIELPSWWNLEFEEDPEKHIVILKTDLQNETTFFSSLKTKLAVTGNRSMLVFIHGYNVSFDEAARRTAQISYDLQFKGAPVFYSWPSNGETLDYPADVGNIEWSTSHIQRFLKDVIEKSSAQNIYIIAHSMGNKGTTRALAQLFRQHPAYRSKVREIILAAPDVDSDIFKTEIAPTLIDLQRPLTLYASSEDKALQVSRTLQQYPRLGQAGDGLVVLPGIETIDASNLKTDFLGHSYFGDSESVIADMYYLIKEEKRAKDRFRLEAVNSQGKTYYKFKK